ncbi:MAG: glycosyltransferase family 39 protein [Dehalococcoidia bacterium]|nr:glycosyltransferase family 39 protein [Dehalococcoidia bacterium]
MTVSEPQQPPSSPAAAKRSRASQSLAAARIRVVAFVVMAVALGFFAQHRLVEDRRLDPGLALWALAIAVFLAALWFARRLPAASDSSARDSGAHEPPMPRLLEIALFAAAFGTGVLFRFYRIGDIPPGLNHDAAWNGLYAITITQGIDYAPYTPAAWGRETMFHYIIAFWQLIVGHTQFAIQLAAISVGIVTLVPMYLFARRLFGPRFALVATFFLAVSGWHMTLSKVGWRMILVPLFYVLVFYFLLRAVQERRLRDFVLAGVFLGLSLDTYDAARIIPFIAVAYIAYEVLKDRTLLFKRPQLARWGLFAAAAVVAFSPLGWYALNHWELFTGRSRFLWIGNQIDAAGSLEPLWENLKAAALMFNFRGNGDDFFVREPLLDQPLSVFFVLGSVLALVLAVVRWHHPGYFLLVVMLVLSQLVGVASKPNGNRDIGSVIPAVALAAVFLVESWRWLRASYPNLTPAFNAGLVVVLVYAGAVTFDDYLGPNRRTQWGFYPETTRVGRYVKTIAPDYEVHLAAGNWPRDALTYLSYQGSGDPFQRVYTYTTDATELLGMPLANEKGTAFIIEAVPNKQAVIDELRRRYPDAPTHNIHYPDGSDKTIAVALLIPPGATPKPPEEGEEPYTPPAAAERDEQRRAALSRIREALLDYREETGNFPDTGGSVQTSCAYTDLDKLCVIGDRIGMETLIDPRGDVHRYGYWYESDGESFTVYATFEGPPSPEEACVKPHPSMAGRPYLVCLRNATP